MHQCYQDTDKSKQDPHRLSWCAAAGGAELQGAHHPSAGHHARGVWAGCRRAHHYPPGRPALRLRTGLQVTPALDCRQGCCHKISGSCILRYQPWQCSCGCGLLRPAKDGSLCRLSELCLPADILLAEFVVSASCLGSCKCCHSLDVHVSVCHVKASEQIAVARPVVQPNGRVVPAAVATQLERLREREELHFGSTDGVHVDADEVALGLTHAL